MVLIDPFALKEKKGKTWFENQIQVMGKIHNKE